MVERRGRTRACRCGAGKGVPAGRRGRARADVRWGRAEGTGTVMVVSSSSSSKRSPPPLGLLLGGLLLHGCLLLLLLWEVDAGARLRPRSPARWRGLGSGGRGGDRNGGERGPGDSPSWQWTTAGRRGRTRADLS
jgi:hypothetical protein